MGHRPQVIGHRSRVLSDAFRFRDGRGLQMILCTQTDELMRSQKTVQEAVKRLEGPASKEVIEEATVCHLRPVRLPLNKYGRRFHGYSLISFPVVST